MYALSSGTLWHVLYQTEVGGINGDTGQVHDAFMQQVEICYWSDDMWSAEL